MSGSAMMAPPSPTLAGALVRITADQYQQMLEDGIIPEDASTELLDGLIVKKDRGDLGGDSMAQSARHSAVVAMISKLGPKIEQLGCHLRIQSPVAMSELHQPEPDGAIVRGQIREYVDQLPAPADVLCVIEIAHSSLQRDREDKLPVYARGGIAQYLIINLQAGSIEIYTQPDSDNGTYRTKVTASGQDLVRMELGQEKVFEVIGAEILP